MAYALPIIALVGTAVSTVATVAKSTDDAAAANFNFQQQQKNAAATEVQGAEEERMARISAAKQIGGLAANYGASGVTSDGSSSDVLRDSNAEAEADAQKIRYGTQLKAQGYEAQASLYGMEANSDLTGGGLSASATILSGAAKYGYYSGYGANQNQNPGSGL